MDALDEVTPASFFKSKNAKQSKAANQVSCHAHSTSQNTLKPPTVETKKRKPRASSVITAANARLHNNVSFPTKLQEPQIAIPQVQVTPNANAIPLPSASDSKRKGLRHFALRVCRKVERKSVTTYNEVADELVNEERYLRNEQQGLGTEDSEAQALQPDVPLVDEKNIRRRVYDSLNVLMAMRIINKEKKQISWQGLEAAQSEPPSKQTLELLRERMAEMKMDIQSKREEVAEMEDQLRRKSALVNSRIEEERLIQQCDNITAAHRAQVLRNVCNEEERLDAPFMVIHAPRETFINLTMDDLREDVVFNFSHRFGVLDDREILKRMPLLPPDIPDTT